MNEYYQYFGPDYTLDVRPNNMEDLNTRGYLEKLKIQVMENLRQTAFAPSVQGHVEPRIERDEALDDEEGLANDRLDPDVRASKDQGMRDRRRQRDGELSDSEDEGEGGRRDRKNYGQHQRNGNGNGNKSRSNSNEPRAPSSQVSIMQPLLQRQRTETANENGGTADLDAVKVEEERMALAQGMDVDAPAPANGSQLTAPGLSEDAVMSDMAAMTGSEASRPQPPSAS